MNKKAILFRHAVAILLLFLLAVSFFPVSSHATEKEQTESTGTEMVTFNFVDVELPTITKFISDVTGKNFIFDERLRGKVTIIAPSKLSIDDAYSLFTSILEMKGYAIISSGVDAYRIIPASEAKQMGIELSKERRPVNESYIARLMPLENISSDAALKLIRPIVSKDGLVSEFGPGNLLLVIDSGSNIEKILSIIESIDEPSLREEPDIVFLAHSSAEDVVRILNEGAGEEKAAVAGRPVVTAKRAKAVADQRLNAVILFGDRTAKESMKSLIAALDIPAIEAKGRISVYFLEHADATELVKVLEGIISSVQPKARGRSAKGAVPATPFFETEDISVSADSATNALIIVASPSDYENLTQVIRQLDRKRKQVYVEAMIVEASIDKLRELGTRWRVIATDDGEPVAIGGFRSVDPTDIQNLIFGLSGLTGGGLGNFLDIDVNTIDPETGEITQMTLNIPGYAALFNIDEFHGIVNVLSTPQILTSDNQEATIHVGENVPFVSSRERDVTTTNTVLSYIERTDVGIILKITPQITEGDYVRLNIFQEISSVIPERDEEIIINVGPTTSVRSTNTSVVVKDNQTVVISGLIQEQKIDNSTKIPVLGDIPVLGWLFKTESTTKKKTNLLVFITPHIVKDERDIERITEGKRKEFAQADERYEAGELLVKFKEKITDERALEIISEQGASLIQELEGINVYHIQLREGQDVEDAVEDFSSLPEVEYAEPNYRMKIQNPK